MSGIEQNYVTCDSVNDSPDVSVFRFAPAHLSAGMVCFIETLWSSVYFRNQN
jgi:hypothetical protein